MNAGFDNNIQWVTDYLSRIIPPEVKLNFKDPLHEDECRWFRAAIENALIEVRECDPKCSILKGRKKITSHKYILSTDEFIVTKGKERKPRHLFEVSSDPSNPIYFGREYLPHIAAYARLILELGYDQNLSSFSLYRTFSKNLLYKKKGGSYETDAEFYDREGGLYLHVEVKKDPKETEALVEGLNRSGSLDGLNKKQVKELEYVLDLSPKYLWIVGPESVDPERYL